jgi:hypothetical protein
MASEHRGPRRGSIVEGGVEAAAAGARVVEDVVDALSENLGRRSRARDATGGSARNREGKSAGDRGRSKATSAAGWRREPASATAVGEIADLTADLLGRLGEAAQDIADSIGERDWFPPECPTVDLSGYPGSWAKVDFRFTNTAPVALADVGFEATDLIGTTDRIDAGELHFRHGDDEAIARIGPGHSTAVTVAIKIPESASADVYRGVMAARSAAPAGREQAEAGPERAWALLQLEVKPSDPGRAIRSIEPETE